MVAPLLIPALITAGVGLGLLLSSSAKASGTAPPPAPDVRVGDRVVINTISHVSYLGVPMGAPQVLMDVERIDATYVGGPIVGYVSADGVQRSPTLPGHSLVMIPRTRIASVERGGGGVGPRPGYMTQNGDPRRWSAPETAAPPVAAPPVIPPPTTTTRPVVAMPPPPPAGVAPPSAVLRPGDRFEADLSKYKPQGGSADPRLTSGRQSFVVLQPGIGPPQPGAVLSRHEASGQVTLVPDAAILRQLPPGQPPQFSPPAASSPPLAPNPLASAASAIPASPAPSSAPDLLSYNVAQVNKYRAQHGVAPLALDAALSAFALEGSQQLSRDHAPHAHFRDNVKGSSVFANASLMAENQGDPRGVPASYGDARKQIDIMLKMMMDEGPAKAGSSNHYENIVNPRYKKIGVGLFTPGGALYLTNDFSD